MVVKQLVPILKESAQEFGKDKATRLAAALAYYTLFSLTPLLVICISIAGLVWGQEAAQGRVVGELGHILGSKGAEAIQSMIANSNKGKTGVIATIIGFVTLFLGASGVFGQLKDALNTIWGVPEKKKSGFFGLIKERFLSMSAVLGVGFLLLVSLVISSVIGAMGRAMGQSGGMQAVWQVVTLGVDLVVITVAFAFLFRFLPDTRIAWRDVWFGAGFTSLLFTLGKFGIAMYLGKSSLGDNFGPAASLAIILVWLYYSGMIFFFGAEFTEVYSRARAHSGSHAKDSRWAARGASSATPPQSPVIHTVTKPSTARPMPKPEAARSGGTSKAALAGVGAAGMFVGALATSVGAVVVAIKGAKKVLKLG